MILYNILLCILGIVSVCLICLGIIQTKFLYNEIIAGATTKGIVGILAILSICISKQFILADTTLFDLELYSINLVVQNFLILFVTVSISILYFLCIERDFFTQDIPYMVCVVMYPVFFLALPYIFDFFFEIKE